MKNALCISTLICLLWAGVALGGDRDPFFHGAGKSSRDSAPAETEIQPAAPQAAEPQTKEPQAKTLAPPEPAAGTPGPEPVTRAGFLQQISYSLGYDIISHIGGQVDLDLDYFLRGVEDAHKGSPALTRDQMKQMLMAYQRLARQKAREAAREVLEENLSRGRVFMEGNKLKEGVITLSSGLQYQVLKEGTGPVPGKESTVECHYRGTLLDGTEFDSSYARGRPAVFQVDKVIEGWGQALTRMPAGSTWMLYIPADLAYGERGAGDAIGPGQTLIFEVALLGILD